MGSYLEQAQVCWDSLPHGQTHGVSRNQLSGQQVLQVPLPDTEEAEEGQCASNRKLTQTAEDKHAGITVISASVCRPAAPALCVCVCARCQLFSSVPLFEVYMKS